MKIKKKILLAIIIALTSLYFNKVSEIKILKQQLSEVENNYQIFRSAAQDAYGWAVGYDSGEQIPGEFFERYMDDNLTQEESEQKYEEAKIIVGERLRMQGM